METKPLQAAGQPFYPETNYEADGAAEKIQKAQNDITELQTDIKASLNSAKTYADSTYMQATGYTDQKIADLINGAPATMDTLKEIADAMAENKSVVEALDAAIGTKASEAEFQSHDANKTIHITASERSDLNEILNPKFSQAETRDNIESGEKIPVILSKIKKFFADLKTVAFSGKYDDLDGKPLSLKNPQALTFTGGATGSYDGSTAKTVAIPTAVNVVNDLNSTSTTDALSAAQGKVLNDSLGFDTKLIDGVPNWSPRGADTWNPFKKTLINSDIVINRNSKSVSNGAISSTYTAPDDGIMIVFGCGVNYGTIRNTNSSIVSGEAKVIQIYNDAYAAAHTVGVFKVKKGAAINVYVAGYPNGGNAQSFYTYSIFIPV